MPRRAAVGPPCATSGVAMGRADGDGDAGFAELQMAQAMDDGAAGQRPATASFGFKLGELFLGHFGVAFVVERRGAAALGKFAGCAEEQDDRAGVTRGNLGEDGGRIDG